MTTLAGEQVGVFGSSCVQKEGCGGSSCIDGFTEPRAFTVTRPGDEVLLSLRSGTLVAGDRCFPACPPTLRVQPLECQSLAVDDHELIDGQPWVVDLPPGAYWLWVLSHFVSNDGWSGQISAGFGLTVDEHRERTILKHAVPDASCGVGDGGLGVD